MSRLYILLWLNVLLISGCNHSVIPEVVYVPTPVSCVDTVPVSPYFKPVPELKTLPDYELVKELAVYRLQAENYIDTLVAVLTGCIILE